MTTHALPVGGDAPPPHHEVPSSFVMIPARGIDVKAPLAPGHMQGTIAKTRQLSLLPEVTKLTYTLLPPSAYDPSQSVFEAKLDQKGLTEDSYHNWAIQFAGRVFKSLAVTATLEPNSPKFRSLPNLWKFRITTPNVLVVSHIKDVKKDHELSWNVVSRLFSDTILGKEDSPLRLSQHIIGIVPSPCDVE
ncbi:hypothetical protein C8R42DRAFT_721632 [Lentinula raphanica]|nr:hypothetical protein C8R42DRAFT_721632 [Lentinula raphanica]